MNYALWQHRTSGKVWAVQEVGGRAEQASPELTWEEYQHPAVHMNVTTWSTDGVAWLNQHADEFARPKPWIAYDAQGGLPADAVVTRDDNGVVVSIQVGDARLERSPSGLNPNKARLYRQTGTGQHDTKAYIWLGTGLVVFDGNEQAARELLDRNGLTIEAILTTMRPVSP